MINDLRYAVSFPTNGITLTGEHSFQPGSTAISGRNGKGKSFIAEMIRYGLFGTKALRGPATDYKSLDMEIGFTVGGKANRVARGKKVQFIDHEGEVKAVGQDAVNKKVIETLGFGLEVFDVVCSAKQKESERLTKLTPGKRKELIDEVVGLAQQEAVEDACRKEAAGLRREAEALSRALVAPTEPVKPEGYRPSKDIEVELRDTKALVDRRAALQRVIDFVGDSPEPPASPEVDVAAIEAHETSRIQNDARYKMLFSTIERIPDATHTREQLEAAAALLIYDQEVKRRGVTPTYSIEQLDGMTAALDAKAKAKEEVTCPKCEHHFHPGLTAEEEKLAETFVPLTRQQIAGERMAHEMWATPLEQPKGERLTQAEIVEGTKALDRADEKAAMSAELDALPELEDRSAELRAGRAVNQEWAIYRNQLEQYLLRVRAADEARAELAQSEEPKVTVAELDALFVAARVYESQSAAYAEQKAQFDKLSAEIADKQSRAEGYAAGAKGLVEARRALKAFLAPSLSRVATSLIQQMTVNAERPLMEIQVDEDMNITADGQDVSTFNGAHATMVNLALRLALQQVLVSRVFPVFIGDEIDSDLEPTNAQTLTDALVGLRDHLGQLIVISHKRLEGMDEEIML